MNQAMDIVAKTQGKYHILVIVADGQVNKAEYSSINKHPLTTAQICY